MRLVYNQYGKPLEVLANEAYELPKPEAGEALLEMACANINPSDFGMIGGSYGKLKALPAVAGREGVARVLSIPENHASGIKKGDLVKIPEALGVWQSHIVAHPDDLIKIPKSIPADQASTLFINPPTALLLLEDFSDLKSGDWVIQNASNSAVGTAVIQIAKSKGLKTINLVRRESLISELQAIGGDIVILDDDASIKNLGSLTNGAKPKLALNSVGGESVIRMVKSLADGGTCVTFGGMVGDPVRFPTRFLIFNDVRLCGFWMDRWVRSRPRGDFLALMDRVFALVQSGAIKTPIQDLFPLESYREAIEAVSAPRMGKILFRGIC